MTYSERWYTQIDQELVWRVRGWGTYQVAPPQGTYFSKKYYVVDIKVTKIINANTNR